MRLRFGARPRAMTSDPARRSATLSDGEGGWDARASGLRDEVARRFDVAPGAVRVVRAPYRICPLGAHIDHQLGPVTAFALDRCLLLAYAPSPSRDVRLLSR